MSSVEVLLARMASGRAALSRAAKTFFLTSISSNTASTTMSASATRVVAERALDEAHARVHVLLAEAALLHGGRVVLPHDREAAVERLLAHLDHAHRDAGVGEVHGDAAAHGAGADDHRLGDRPSPASPSARRGSWRPRAPRRRRGSAPCDWVDCMHWPKSSRSRLRPSSKGRVAAASTASTQRKGAKEPRALRSRPLRNSAKTAGLVAAHLVLHVADLAQRPALGGQALARRRRRPSSRSPGDDLVDDAEGLGLGGGDGIARRR